MAERPEAVDEPQAEPVREPVHAVAAVEVDADARYSAPETSVPAGAEPVREPVAAAAEGPAPEREARAEPKPRGAVDRDPLKPTRKGWWQRRVAVD